VEVAQHVAELRRQGDLLGEAAARTGLDEPIPTCPDWTMRNLLQHVGDVHRWAAAHIAERRALGIRDVAGIAGPLPDDDDLLGWFRDGHAALVRTLESADPDVQCWTFLPAPSPLAFWARRQAHETAIHRADAESPGGRFTPFDPAFAVDGVNELVRGFLVRAAGDPLGEPTWLLRVRATDTGDEWLARVGDQAIDVLADGGEPADCTVATTASDLHLFLWNRLPAERVSVEGDASLLDRWRDVARITWSRPRTRP
jgi:uncharacterized protein (TIGR03083 family)